MPRIYSIFIYINIEIFIGFWKAFLSFGFAAHMNEVSLENCNNCNNCNTAM